MHIVAMGTAAHDPRARRDVTLATPDDRHGIHFERNTVRTSIRSSALVLAAAAGLLLSGCTVDASANFTQSPAQVADIAAGALEEQVGTRPDLDCGDEQIDIVEGETVDCVLTDPGTGTSFGAVVTISEVDGTDYQVGVEVDSAPVE